MHNSGFGTLYGIASGKPMPVCDHTGFAPFGFGYRRCPKAWKDKIEFVKLNVPNPGPVPIGPTTVIADNVGWFVQST